MRLVDIEGLVEQAYVSRVSQYAQSKLLINTILLRQNISCQSGVFPIIFLKMLRTIPTFKTGVGLRIAPHEKIH